MIAGRNRSEGYFCWALRDIGVQGQEIGSGICLRPALCPGLTKMLNGESRQRAIRILQGVGVAEAANEALDLAELAQELGCSATSVALEVQQLEHRGLVFIDAAAAPPSLLSAGQQYLARGGRVPDHVLLFLPSTVDDLNARAALLTAGTVLVDEFRLALLDGDGVDYAIGLVPPAFESAVDERLALNLYSAAVALIARLSCGHPAGCVAEEIVAVGLIGHAEFVLEMASDSGEIHSEEASAATGALHGIFELFQDDDVLALFEMEEPSDAALAGHDPINRQLGVVDQRVEAWFDPFSWAAPTGYLTERPADDDLDDS